MKPLIEAGADAEYAQWLLQGLGFKAPALVAPEPVEPAIRAALTGVLTHSDRILPVPLASCADGALLALQHLAPDLSLEAGTAGGELLVERRVHTAEALEGASDCRLLRTADGRVVINLSREQDWELVPALLLDAGAGAGDWESLAGAAVTRCSAELLKQGRLLGLPMADAQQPLSASGPWCVTTAIGTPVKTQSGVPLVVDLSSLWAGPLCSHLWQRAGASVIKVEGAGRPDGARLGSPEFYDLLNEGKAAVSLDFNSPQDMAMLRALICDADIVIEGSRPRVLRQRGLSAEDMLRANPGLTWVALSGYGRSAPRDNWVAFGDDAAVAAGLSAIGQAVFGEWLVWGDAVADPLTGVHAALAGWASWLSGGSRLLDINLHGVVAHCIAVTAPADGDYRRRHREWARETRGVKTAPVPRRLAAAPAPVPGADNAQWLPLL